MRHLLRIAISFFVLVFVAPAHVEAGLFSWLDRLSGPGPFWGIDFGIALRCPKPDPETPEGQARPMGDTIRVSCSDERLDRKHFNWYLNAGVAGTIRNNLNYGDRPEPEPSTAIGLVKMGTSVDYTLDASLDVGAGVGFLYFGGPSFVNFARPYVQPLRVTLRPLLLGWKPKPDCNCQTYKDRLRRRGWLLINFNLNMVLGTIDGATFGAPADPFRAHNEIVPEVGLGLDVVKLFKRPAKPSTKK